MNSVFKFSALSTLLFLGVVSLLNAQEWEPETPAPTTRGYVASCVLNGKIFVIGGGSTGEIGSSKVEAYDPVTDTWVTTIADLPFPTFAPAATVLEGKLYVMGGKLNYPSQDDYNTLFVYDPIQNTWIQKNSMTVGRSHLTACSLNGKIYAIGGRTDDQISMKTVERYDPGSDTWAPVASLQIERANISAQVVEGKIYVMGGIANGPDASSVETYDPATNTWEITADMPDVNYFCSTSGEGKIYLIGGVKWEAGNNVASMDVHEYDVLSGVWDQLPSLPDLKVMGAAAVVGCKIYALTGALEPFFLPNLPGPATTASVLSYDFKSDNTVYGEWTYRKPMPTPRAYHTAAKAYGRVFVIGGAYSPAATSNVVEAFDPRKDTWETMAGLPVPILGASAQTIDGKVYVAGGQDLYVQNSKNTLYVYDPLLNSWSAKAPMPTARGYLATAVVEGYLYAIGGTAVYPNRVNTVERYDPATDTWETKAPMPTARSGFNCEVINGKIYAVGGVSLNGYYNIVEVYDPATDSWTAQTSMPQNRCLFGSGVIGDELYAYGGALDGVTTLQNAYIYNTGAHAWSDVPGMMPELKVAFASAAFDCCLLGFGGALGPFFTGGAGDKVSGTVLQYCPEIITSVRKLDDIRSEKLFVYPNPFSDAARIVFTLEYSEKVILDILDVHGKTVTTLVQEELPAGRYEAAWNAFNLPPGMYICRLRAGNYVSTRKCVLNR